MRIHSVIAACLLVAWSIASACAQQVVNPMSLVGTWQTSAQHPSGAMIKTAVQFTKDLQFATASTVNDKPFIAASGTWVLTGTMLEWRYERSSHPAIQPGYVDIDEVLSVGESELRVVSKLSGKTHIYRRSQ